MILPVVSEWERIAVLEFGSPPWERLTLLDGLRWTHRVLDMVLLGVERLYGSRVWAWLVKSSAGERING